MMTCEDLKQKFMAEQSASRDWAKASLDWADAAALWEEAVKKTPNLSEARARWASAGRSWMSAARAWAPRSDKSCLPGNNARTSASCDWAAVAARWALESISCAVAAGRDPRESIPGADLAAIEASDAQDEAKPQSIWETMAVAPMENPVHDRHEGVEAAREDTASPAKPSIAETQQSGDSAGKDTTRRVAGAEPALPQDQARGDETGTSHKATTGENKAGVVLDLENGRPHQRHGF